MKRGIEDREVETMAMANCLMLLNRVGKTTTSSSDRVFECKTCKKQFSSFQALGGHRTSHKKPRLMAGDVVLHMVESPAKPKTHGCPICGMEFPMGQALGGHMRRHRSPASRDSGGDKSAEKIIPVLKKCNSKRILCLDLDLNLTPYENELKLFPALGCF